MADSSNPNIGRSGKHLQFSDRRLQIFDEIRPMGTQNFYFAFEFPENWLSSPFFKEKIPSKSLPTK